MTNRDLDHCPGCGRRIKDTDDLGCEDAHGQRWCIEHAMRALAKLTEQVADMNVQLTYARNNAKRMSKAHQRRVAELQTRIVLLEREIDYLATGEED